MNRLATGVAGVATGVAGVVPGWLQGNGFSCFSSVTLFSSSQVFICGRTSDGTFLTHCLFSEASSPPRLPLKRVMLSLMALLILLMVLRDPGGSLQQWCRQPSAWRTAHETSINPANLHPRHWFQHCLNSFFRCNCESRWCHTSMWVLYHLGPCGTLHMKTTPYTGEHRDTHTPCTVRQVWLSIAVWLLGQYNDTPIVLVEARCRWTTNESITLSYFGENCTPSHLTPRFIRDQAAEQQLSHTHFFKQTKVTQIFILKTFLILM